MPAQKTTPYEILRVYEEMEAARENLREAVTLYVETAIESNLPILRPIPADENPQVSRPNDVVDTFHLSLSVHASAHV